MQAWNIWRFESILLKSQNLSTLGGNNNINVVIADYKPNVKCDSTSTPGPAWASCVAIFANMRATKQARVFGYSGDPSVEEELPLVLEGGKKAQLVYTPVRGTVRLIFCSPSFCKKQPIGSVKQASTLKVLRLLRVGTSSGKR